MMTQKYSLLQQPFPYINNQKRIPLFSGIELCYFSLTGDTIDKVPAYQDKAKNIMTIHYCRSGQIRWEMKNGGAISLSAGNFFLDATPLSICSKISLPSGSYEGLFIHLDLEAFTSNPPELLLGTGITGSSLYEKLCRNAAPLLCSGNAQTDAIFPFFFQQPAAIQTAYQKIKVLELLLYLSQKDTDSFQPEANYPSGQIEIVRRIHQQLLSHLDQRITIEELSKQYLINPTTMKEIFKSIYGTSIAAHIKEHRMQTAAKMLSESEMSIAQIARSVGYDSQSKFSTAFKAYFQMLPTEYRKRRAGDTFQKR